MAIILKKMTLKDLIEFGYYLLAGLAFVVMAVPLSHWFYLRVSEPESYYSHCPLVLILCLWMVGRLVWKYYKQIGKLPRFGEYARGKRLLGVVLACLIYLAGGWLKIYFLMAIGIVFVFLSVVWCSVEDEVFQSLRFWLWFMVFSVPLPMVVSEQLAVKLKLVSARLAGFLLTKMGILTLVIGNTLKTSRMQLEVGAPCSGVRSLLTMVVLSILLGHVKSFPLKYRAVLLLFAPFVAFVGNVLRIFVLGFVADVYGVDIALGKFHDILGYVIFVLDIALMLGVSELVDRLIYIFRGKTRIGENRR